MAAGTIADLKTCTKCGVAKPPTTAFFHKHPKSPDGLKPRCKKCRREESLARYQQKGEQIRADALAWQKNNPERAKQRKQRWGRENQDRVRQQKRKWRVENHAALRKKENARCRERMRTDAKFRLSKLMSQQIRLSLKNGKGRRSWLRLVDFNVDDLKKHIERQFARGMNWGVFFQGRIYIDHIRPVSSFRYKSSESEGFKECWSLTNLRPVWAAENLRKGAQRIFLV